MPCICNCGSQDGPVHRPHSTGCTVYADDARDEMTLGQRQEVLRTRLKKINDANQTVKVTIEIPVRNIVDLFITAKDGGIDHWAKSMDCFRTDVSDTEGHVEDRIGHGSIRIITNAEDWNRLFDIDFDMERQGPGRLRPYRRGLDDVQKAFGIMANKYPRYFADFMTDDTDVTTADVFVQLCCFGEVIFG